MKNLDNSKTKQEEPVSCDVCPDGILYVANYRSIMFATQMSIKKLQQRVTNERRFQEEKRKVSQLEERCVSCEFLLFLLLVVPTHQSDEQL